MDGDTITIIASVGGTVVVVGLALAGLIMRATSRIDSDRRAADARHDADLREFRGAMDTFRSEMQRLAERQSHLEGRIDGQRSAAD